MSAHDDELRQGMAHQQAGRWPEALACFLQAISAHPQEARAHLLAGVAEAHCGRMAEAIVRLRESLTLDPALPEAAQALGGAYLASGRMPEAVTALEHARRLAPASASVVYELAAAYGATRQPAKAVECYRAAVVLQPEFADAHNNLGNLLKHEGKLDEAEASYQRAIDAAPGHAQAWFNLGIVRQLRDAPDRAIAAYERALQLSPANAPAANNLGLVLRAQKRLTEAIAAFRRALAINPKYDKAMSNLGSALQETNQLAEATSLLEQAVALAPQDANALCTLGNVLVATNRPKEGIAVYARALAIKPSLPEVTYNIALAQLVLGDLANGWVGYDTRTTAPRFTERYRFLKPRWTGAESLAGKTILLFAEQGLGDTLMFVRFIPQVAALAARVVVRVQAALKPLLGGQWENVLVLCAEDGMPSYDLQCPLLSLPLALGIRLETIPAPVAYVTAPPAKLAAWRAVFARGPGLKVGIVWSGNPKHQYDHNRSLPLESFLPVTQGVPAHFFVIQKDLRPEDARLLLAHPEITDLSRQLNDFTDTAGLVAALDLVICVDTSVAHLAGALGQKTWTLVSFSPDWRWLLEREDSPWYPSMRLFRQSAPGEWAVTLTQVHEALRALAVAAST